MTPHWKWWHHLEPAGLWLGSASFHFFLTALLRHKILKVYDLIRFGISIIVNIINISIASRCCLMPLLISPSCPLYPYLTHRDCRQLLICSLFLNNLRFPELYINGIMECVLFFCLATFIQQNYFDSSLSLHVSIIDSFLNWDIIHIYHSSPI